MYCSKFINRLGCYTNLINSFLYLLIHFNYKYGIEDNKLDLHIFVGLKESILNFLKTLNP